MKTLKSTFRFQQKASLPRNAVALMYDLEGFSRFFNQPDVHEYIAEYLNHISDEIGIVLYGGDASWVTQRKPITPLAMQVAHEKYLGDGALYILLPSKGSTDFSQTDLVRLCNRLWNLKQGFGEVTRSALEKVPVAEIPTKIRFGISRGAVYELKSAAQNNAEYVGFCLNLASRLQSYCRDLGFIASARLRIPDAELSKNNYKKVIATAIKGFSNELVIVDQAEYEALNPKIRRALFQKIDEG